MRKNVKLFSLLIIDLFIDLYKIMFSAGQWYTLLISAPGRHREKDLEFKASLGYMVSSRPS
jgi:hypothetical protein